MTMLAPRLVVLTIVTQYLKCKDGRLLKNVATMAVGRAEDGYERVRLEA